MKKNLLFALALGAVFTVISCDQSNTASDTVETEETASTQSQPQQIENPNVVSASNAAPANAVASANAPVIEFKETEYDFGTIKQGEVVEHTFEFTNTGKSPLIIESTSAPCGCTVPEHTEEPIAPGQTGKVKVRFNSSGKMGQQSPIVTVRANTEPNITQVYMRGTVEANNIPTAGADGPVRRN
ncbi:DUF1573 domain-containing protein [Pontibacter sp. SGAir0037]|uniref:DUF1573 domain-containing protein n=1 Tax=Pontibacter sp. SGAir0037 TaxID=2571030 RepID=UPI0010CD3856|nr:DUF1573 domain-containing protein [Pontibacter sp. SGAir0037]QCR24082.1 DUF1573 domain-containing protein [Pontibacter sp. SGAir0037]